MKTENPPDLDNPYITSSWHVELLHKVMKRNEPQFDSDENLLLLKRYNNIHIDSVKSDKGHFTRESLYYALGLLLMNQKDKQEIAERIILKVVSVQYRNPGHERHGLWHYFADESVEGWEFPDMNWADFNGMTLLLIWNLFEGKLEVKTKEAIKEALRAAAECIIKRNVGMGYTNIAVKGTFVTMAVAELLEDSEIMEYAEDRVKRLHQEIIGSDVIREFCSPTYTPVSIEAAMAFNQFVQHEPSKKLMLEIEHRFWKHLIPRIHLPTRELAGPYSRCYGDQIEKEPFLPGPIIEEASEHVIRYDYDNDSGRENSICTVVGLPLKPNIPEELKSYFSKPDRKELVREEIFWLDNQSAWISSYIHPQFCIGSVSFMDGWSQHRNLIAHWHNKEGGKGLLNYFYLAGKDGCSSGFFISAQNEEAILGASFLVDGGLVGAWRKVDGVKTDFLGPVMKIENGESPIRLEVDDKEWNAQEKGQEPLPLGSTIWIDAGGMWLAFELLAHDIGTQAITVPQLKYWGTGLEIRMPHYEGVEKELKWKDFEYAHSAFRLCYATPKENDWESWKEKVQNAKVQVQSNENHLSLEHTVGKIKIPKKVMFFKDAPKEAEVEFS